MKHNLELKPLIKILVNISYFSHLRKHLQPLLFGQKQ